MIIDTTNMPHRRPLLSLQETFIRQLDRGGFMFPSVPDAAARTIAIYTNLTGEIVSQSPGFWRSLAKGLAGAAVVVGGGLVGFAVGGPVGAGVGAGAGAVTAGELSKGANSSNKDKDGDGGDDDVWEAAEPAALATQEPCESGCVWDARLFNRIEVDGKDQYETIVKEGLQHVKSSYDLPNWSRQSGGLYRIHFVDTDIFKAQVSREGQPVTSIESVETLLMEVSHGAEQQYMFGDVVYNKPQLPESRPLDTRDTIDLDLGPATDFPDGTRVVYDVLPLFSAFLLKIITVPYATS